jgi:hypothetical protein
MASAASAQTTTRPADPAVLAALERKLPKLELDQIPLTDVLTYLADSMKTNMVVDWRGMEAIGIDRNRPVSLRLRDVPFGDVLRYALRTADARLTYSVNGNVIEVNVGVPATQPLR